MGRNRWKWGEMREHSGKWVGMFTEDHLEEATILQMLIEVPGLCN